MRTAVDLIHSQGNRALTELGLFRSAGAPCATGLPKYCEAFEAGIGWPLLRRVDEKNHSASALFLSLINSKKFLN
jgi:hypothetical protein